MQPQKTSVIFILPSLNAGGAERVLSFVAANLNKKVFEVSLVVFGFEKDNAYDTEGLKVDYFNKSRVLSSIPKLATYLLENKPQIVVSCMDHVTIPVAFILSLLPNTKLVTRQANIKSISDIVENQTDSWFYRQMVNRAHKRTTVFICQSEDMASEMEQYYQIDKKKLVVINNPISDGFTLKDATQKSNILSFITVGRLHAEKGHERILRILSKLEFPFHYTIIGTGNELETISKLIKSLKLESQVTYIPYSTVISEYLSTHDVFLQGSYAEGFPNAVLESCAVGTPVIAFHAPGGTSEIIEHGINGYLASDEEEFIYYINLFYKKNEFLPKQVRETVFKKFNKWDIIEKYENLFSRLGQGQS
ncbi:glycosyltransferase involved in cell wall biosynthesis [Gelidibacter sediminis]|uniref:Glycosyltransferase involved in cell wall biosynthesis n=1 Tax=Gelidibacter sediminis TaxID=1608710 RepID=A0A4R7PYG6_9FLAO|nr:glycosyltransferase [Gelidibacter sediminis]TDU40008.1 glycosyltransferase involved in cell wall biosynthesis [Gelidibacter sediminis]